ncbi:unnamed protein product [Chrysoparadoxa australica]
MGRKPTPPVEVPSLAGEQDAFQVVLTALLTMGSILFIMHKAMSSNKSKVASPGTWLASPTQNGAKYKWEMFNLYYSAVWISCFVAIVAFKLYESFDAAGYMAVCGGLTIPIFLLPLFDFAGISEAETCWHKRFSFRANLWMAIYSFIGNYWYTHYFYCILKAGYSMPSWRLNDVPIPLYFATFFYFCTYHSLSNAAIRKVCTSYSPSTMRALFLVLLVVFMSYVTAFMETFTISAYPDYFFEDRNMMYSIGSAFYGIYFLVSFPMFYRFDEWPRYHGPVSLLNSCVDSLGCGMLILLGLDFTRLLLGMPLTIK